MEITWQRFECEVVELFHCWVRYQSQQCSENILGCKNFTEFLGLKALGQAGVLQTLTTLLAYILSFMS